MYNLSSHYPIGLVPLLSLISLSNQLSTPSNLRQPELPCFIFGFIFISSLDLVFFSRVVHLRPLVWVCLVDRQRQSLDRTRLLDPHSSTELPPVRPVCGCHTDTSSSLADLSIIVGYIRTWGDYLFPTKSIARSNAPAAPISPPIYPQCLHFASGWMARPFETRRIER